MIYPDDFTDSALYTYEDRYYAVHDGTWFRLWGWVPDGGREATAVTDSELIEMLDHYAVEVTGSK